MADRRNDQSKLTDAEWHRLIEAINQLHGVGAEPPAYREFVKLHTDAMTTARGMTWEVHTMQNMGTVGRNFLAWHRRYVRSFELRLQKAVSGVTIPFWDWTKDRSIPRRWPTPPSSRPGPWSATALIKACSRHAAW